MNIQTSRFGQVQIEKEDVLLFSEGLLGFANLRQFVLLDDPTDEVFAWLQSCEQPDIAFPVLEPEFFADSYKFTLTKNDMEALGLKDMQKTKIFCIVTIPEDPVQMTANLKAPIIINIPGRIARQCVLQDNSLAIREPIFLQLQQRVVQSPTSSLRIRAQGEVKPQTTRPLTLDAAT